MDPLNLKRYSKYFFIGSFILIIIFSIFLVKSFLTSIFGAILLAYIFYPVYVKMQRAIRNKTLCSLILTIIVVLILTVPVLFAANAIVNESVGLFYKINDLSAGDINHYIQGYFSEEINIGAYVKDVLDKFSVYIMQESEKFILDIPNILISLFVILFVMFYLFKEGKKLVNLIGYEIPLSENYKKIILNKFNSLISATIYGSIVTSIIVGALGALGFYIFGLDSPVLWGIVMTILSMLPVVGTGLIWLPVGIYLLFTQNIWIGVGFLIYNFVIVSGIDNLARPKIIGDRSKVHPVFVVLGVIGGLKVFGLVGVIIGPLLLAILALFFELYISEQNEIKSKRH